MSKHITHKIITCNDKDAPWITPQEKLPLNVIPGFTENGSIGEEILKIMIMFGKYKTKQVKLLKRLNSHFSRILVTSFPILK